VNTSIEFDRQPSLEAVEIGHPVLQAALAAELCAQLSAPQEIPRGSFGVSLVAPQFPDAFGWDAHGESIAAWTDRGRESLVIVGTDPSPVRRRPVKAPSPDTLSPRERGLRQPANSFKIGLDQIW